MLRCPEAMGEKGILSWFEFKGEPFPSKVEQRVWTPALLSRPGDAASFQEKRGASASSDSTWAPTEGGSAQLAEVLLQDFEADHLVWEKGLLATGELEKI